MGGKKRVCFIGHTESTCTYATLQLIRFLSQYIEVTTWCTEFMHIPPADLSADLFIISNQTVYDAVRQWLPANRPVIIAERVINIEMVDRLFELEPGTRAYVVGTAEERVNHTIRILHGLGFRFFDLVPYYPGIMKRLPDGIDIAITTGHAHLAPKQVRKIIDLGGKGLDLSTFADLLTEIREPMAVLNDISCYYLEKIMSNTQKIQNIGKNHEALKQRLEVILDTVGDAIIATDKLGSILLFNPAAQKLLNLQIHQTLGRAVKDIIPGIDFSACLKTGEGIRHKITRVADAYYIVNANAISDANGKIDGIVATLSPVNEVQELETKVRRELKKKGNIAKYSFTEIIGQSSELNKAVSLANKFAQTELTILLEGESGTGKELFAQSIHNASPRKSGPFVAVNFAAIPENLIESELFGYEDGAFTGAKRGGKPGLFEEAHLGTIFLDEIGSASLDVQKRLLRVLEEKEVRRLGSGSVTPIDVRIVAACNRRLEAMVEAGKFRFDLFYRLCGLPIIIPPLRQRRDDILILANYFIEKYGANIKLNKELAAFLTNYGWPGNVRELQNVIRYVCNLVDSAQDAGMEHLPQYLFRDCAGSSRLDAALQPSHKCSSIPAELNDPRTLNLASLMLREIARASSNGAGIGWCMILKSIAGNVAVSQNIIKRCLRLLNRLGYTQSGVTRQGTKITSKGIEFLDRLSR